VQRQWLVLRKKHNVASGHDEHEVCVCGEGGGLLRELAAPESPHARQLTTHLRV
jgi:hypothetical protein